MFIVGALLAQHRAELYGVVSRSWPTLQNSHGLGRISYSLYLVHLVILLTLMNVLNGVVSPYWILAGTVGLSLLMAGAFYHYLERPSIWLVRYLTLSRHNI